MIEWLILRWLLAVAALLFDLGAAGAVDGSAPADDVPDAAESRWVGMDAVGRSSGDGCESAVADAMKTLGDGSGVGSDVGPVACCGGRGEGERQPEGDGGGGLGEAREQQARTP